MSLIDTGLETMTGGRLGRIRHLLDDGEDFCMTYGDGVGDIDVTSLVNFPPTVRTPRYMTAPTGKIRRA